MFGEQFYPTPRAVIERMLSPWTLVLKEGGPRLMPGSSFLDPSAGKGDLLDYLNEVFGIRKSHLLAIELDPHLRSILAANGYTVLDSDFLGYSDPAPIDRIVMNPPFAHGDEHLLHAWDLLEDGGKLVCVLNAETIRNPYSTRRKLLLNLIETVGAVEFMADAFVDAERSTDVEIAIVWLNKPDNKARDWFGNRHFQHDPAVDDDEQFAPNALASTDVLQQLVAQFDRSVELIKQQHVLERELMYYNRQTSVTSSFERDEDARRGISPEEREQRDGKADDKAVQQKLSEKIAELKKMYWKYIIRRTKILERVTSQYRKALEKQIEQTTTMSFTYRNVMEVLQGFVQDRQAIMMECVDNVFDMTMYYHKDNRVWEEGWKSNKSWKCNHKIVIPSAVEKNAWGAWSMRYRTQDFFVDLDKVLCWISGVPYDSDVSTTAAVEARMQALRQDDTLNYSDKFETHFFWVRFFQKGTLHLEFKDRDLLARFNLVAAQGKPDLGSGT